MDMSGDEYIALFAGLIGSVWGLWLFVIPLFALPGFGGRGWGGSVRWILLASLAVPFVPLLLVLTHVAAREVLDEVGLIVLFVVCGATLEGVILSGGAMLGVRWRDDALERRNPAAVAALSGALLGGMLLYAGANIGEGPTIWTTFGPAAMGLGLWAGLWLIVQLFADPGEAIAVERDAAAGIRLGSYLLASGAMLGRAVAGDWVSIETAVSGLIMRGWPVLLLTAATLSFQFALQPKVGVARHPLVAGVVPGLVLLCGSAGWIAWQGGI